MSAPDRIWVHDHRVTEHPEKMHKPERFVEYHRAPAWVSVEDRLPKDGQEVWFTNGEQVFQGWYRVEELVLERGFTCGNGYIKNIIKWMPFIVPSPPKEIE